MQNKLQLATPLPEVVQQQGIKVSKSTRNFLLIIGLVSEDGSMNGIRSDRLYGVQRSGYHLSRVDGVGEVQLFGSQYAMRIWLNPDKLDNYRLTTSDVKQALQTYNVQVSAGQFGGLPAAEASS